MLPSVQLLMSYLESYNRNRRLVRSSTIPSSDLLQQRSDIISSINDTHSELVPPSVLERHFRGIPLWKISQLLDRQRSSTILHPGFYESIYATTSLKTAAESFAKLIPPTTKLLIAGSFAWGPYYAPAMSTIKESKVASDLDFEIILGTEKEWDDIAHSALASSDTLFAEGFSLFRQLYQQGVTDYFAHHRLVDNMGISTHFLPMTTIDKICQLPLSRLQQTVTMTELRTTPKKKDPCYFQRSFLGNLCVFDCEVQQFDGYIVTKTPQQIVLNEQLYLGLLPNKLIHAPLVLQATPTLNQALSNLKREVIQRIVQEETTFHDQRSLVLSLSSYQRTPAHVINQLKAEELKLRKQFQQSNE